MAIRFVMATAALAIVSGCSGGATEPAGEAKTDISIETPEPDNVPDSIPAIADEPVYETITIEIDTDILTASANIDGAISAFAPALGERIKTETEEALETAKSVAAEDKDEEYFMPHDYQYDYIKTATVGDIISVEFMNMFYTGGAHPNYMIGGIIYDRANEADIPAKALLSEDGTAAVKSALMEKLAVAKLKRMSMEPQDLPVLREEVAEVFPVDVEFWFGEVTLVPSTEPEKFGGAVVHYSPYEVGPYAEGSYDLLLSAAELQGHLAPDYAGLFGGDAIYEEVQ